MRIPFPMTELIARISGVLGRIRLGLADDRLNHGDIVIDRVAHRVRRSGQEIHLGPTEFRLLELFMSSPNRAFDRAQLLDRVWGRSIYVEERTVDVHIRRLRVALSVAKCDVYIETVRGVGYRATRNPSTNLSDLDPA
jgi:two-component system phosphate regulon response regulator PhoB